MNRPSEEYLKQFEQPIAQAFRLREWLNLTDAGLRLRCGELTAQEIRTVRAVLNAIAGANTAVSDAERRSL